MKLTLPGLLILLSTLSYAQSDSLLEIEKFQKELNAEYLDPAKSPLNEKEQKKFKGHEFYPVNLSYRVEAELIPTEGSAFFEMPTSNLVKKAYRVYGKLKFTLHGLVFEIPVYQSQRWSQIEGYKNHLFFPFTDLTNGKGTYDAGRYIDLSIPTEGNNIILDFNQAYNPFCAYSDKYSCPIVPAANYIDYEIQAGVKYDGKKKK